MSPLPSLPCAPRVFAALAVMATLLAALGCGSGFTLVHPLPGGFSNASLTGQYVIAQTGIAMNQTASAADPFSEVIVFTADGKGNLTVAFDDFDQSGSPFEDTNLPGTYSISRDGTGTLAVNFTSGSSNYAITMIDDSHFYIIEQDLSATASGFGEKQTATTLPTGNFVFKAHNVDTSSRVGGINFTGNTITGAEDLLDAGSLSTRNAVTGSVIQSSFTNGHGQFTLNDGTAATYFCDVVSSGKFVFLSSTGTLEIGQAEAQTGGPFSLATLASGASYVFGSGGDTSVSGQAGIHSAGVFSGNGNGNISSGSVDYVQDANINSALTVSNGTYTLDSTTGSGQINLPLSNGNTITQKFWTVNGMASGTRGYFLVDNASAVEDGTFTLQQGAPFSTLGNQAAFVMDGFDVAYKDRAGVFQPVTGGFNWNQAANSFDPNPFDPTFGGSPSTRGTNGTAQVSSNGRVTVTVNGVTANSGLVFYLSSPGSGFMVQEDANTLGGVNDIGGAFTLQANQ